ncbi:substrate-binding domain-containing protein [Caldicellulosiruptoraceae bacterium PP1]
MKRVISLLTIVVFISIFMTSVYAKTNVIKLATTTSVYDSGLLDYIIPKYEKISKNKVMIMSVGSGQAKKLLENGDVDIILIHEKDFMEELKDKSIINEYKDIFYNKFILVGPKGYEKYFTKSKTINDCFKAIYKNNINFLTRADNSGTYMKELEIWNEIKINPNFKNYIKTGQGMGMTLLMADEKKAFTLTDNATFYSMLDKFKNLKIYYDNSNDKILKNVYSTAYRKDDIKAKSLYNWLTSDKLKVYLNYFNKKTYKKEVFISVLSK